RRDGARAVRHRGRRPLDRRRHRRALPRGRARSGPGARATRPRARGSARDRAPVADAALRGPLPRGRGPRPAPPATLSRPALAARRAQALTVDPAQLRQLLGEVELRELLDANALAELELQLQHLEPDRVARHADGAHDLLIRLGDLTRDELKARSEPGAPVD